MLCFNKTWMKTIGFRRRLDGLVEFGNDQKFSLALACKRGLRARDRDETEMFEILFETRPRRDLARFSRDRDETETIKIKSRGRLEAETSRPRLHPWAIPPKGQTGATYNVTMIHSRLGGGGKDQRLLTLLEKLRESWGKREIDKTTFLQYNRRRHRQPECVHRTQRPNYNTFKTSQTQLSTPQTDVIIITGTWAHTASRYCSRRRLSQQNFENY